MRRTKLENLSAGNWRSLTEDDSRLRVGLVNLRAGRGFRLSGHLNLAATHERTGEALVRVCSPFAEAFLTEWEASLENDPLTLYKAVEGDYFDYLDEVAQQEAEAFADWNL